MEQLLGFRVVELHGSWQIQHLDEEGKVTRVQPCLTKEIWELWLLAKTQHEALPR
jgi:hypothetical protein